MRQGLVWVVVGIVAGALHPGSAAAQVRIHSKAADLTITGMVQSQFNTTSVSGARSAEFLVRRARLSAEIVINDFVSGKVEPDFGQGTLTLRDAFVRLTLSPALRATVGQFKRPFDLFKLVPVADILVIERTGSIRGVDACAGVGGACSFGQLVEGLLYADRDIGAQLDGQADSGRFTYAVAVTNGPGPNKADENGTKSYTARVSISPVDGIRLAANMGIHDYVDSTRGDRYASAFGADVEIGDYAGGLHIQAGVATGDNWKNLGPGGPRTFLTGQSIVAYRFALRPNRFVSAVEPVLRVSAGDPSTGIANDGGWLFTPGVVLHFVGRNKLGANLDIWTPDAGAAASSLKVQLNLFF